MVVTEIKELYQVTINFESKTMVLQVDTEKLSVVEYGNRWFFEFISYSSSSISLNKKKYICSTSKILIPVNSVLNINIVTHGDNPYRIYNDGNDCLFLSQAQYNAILTDKVSDGSRSS
jgi:hypothetical protein